MKLSVLLITYNHARYIREALDSVLWQDIDFPFEVVVCDDASTDNTRELVAEYVGKDPRISFRFLADAPNMGVTRNYQRGFAAVESEYVATLEGDDIWCSPQKLSQQLAFLEAHRECSVCGCNYFVYLEEEARYTERVERGEGFRYLDSRQLIADNLIGNFSTCMYRADSLKRLPAKLFDMRAYDWAVNIVMGRFGLIGFLNTPMSIYRIHGAGTWSLLSHRQKLTSQLEVLPQYDAITDGVFAEDFNALAARLRAAGAGEGHVPAFQLRRIARRGTSLLIQFIPPLLVTILKQLVPPVCWRVVYKFIGRRA
ncbi:glycosyl transferase [Cupriavidus sp. TKC]|uniref:glycosyltransferase n=1 Tax=unclassified Cupriavidus TaxID=2640874 RepID=UPI0002A230B0|nr:MULTISPECIES: glycosyltransferase [unclassified Cupriavidus]ELA00677.1 glycosyl transferase family protein [Cupriavidus sp. HMR-1]GMG90991.1 glycosyl transferase [Cupriavidus sp. TKC]